MEASPHSPEKKTNKKTLLKLQKMTLCTFKRYNGNVFPVPQISADAESCQWTHYLAPETLSNMTHPCENHASPKSEL